VLDEGQRHPVVRDRVHDDARVTSILIIAIAGGG
jgi:hypothetical protein